MGKDKGQPDALVVTRMRDARRGLDTARRELRYSPRVAGAARAIVSAWSALAQEAGVEGDDELSALLDGSGAIEPEAWRKSLSRVRELSRRDEEQPAADPGVRLELRDQIDWLARAIAARERNLRAQASWGARVRKPSLPAAVGVVAVVGLVLAAVAAEPATPRPWRGAFHTGLDLSSEAVIRRLPRLDFAWGQRAPVPGVDANSFSVRFDSCLIVPEASRGAAGQRVPLRFRLQSDEGAQLWLDEKSLLAEWERRGASEQEGDAFLTSGPHHLRVEYRDIRGKAHVSLEISRAPSDALETEDRRIPDGWLAAPLEPFDASDPCRLRAGGRAE